MVKIHQKLEDLDKFPSLPGREFFQQPFKPLIYKISSATTHKINPLKPPPPFSGPRTSWRAAQIPPEDLEVVQFGSIFSPGPRRAPTWRIIPVSKWLITMVSKSPNWGCGTPYKWPNSMAYFHGGDPNY